MLKAAEVVLIRRNGDHPFRILGLYGAGRNIEVSCVQSKHNPSTTSLAHINSTTCYNVQVRGKYLRLIIVWSGFPDNNLFFFSLLFVPLCNGHFCQKCQSLRPKKWHFEWPNQNSKTTFIVQTFPKYGPYDFYLVNLSLLGAILAIFQFCGFLGLFWPFFPCNCNV